MIDKKINSFVEVIRPYNMVSGIIAFNIGYLWLGTKQHFGFDYYFALLQIILGFSFATIQNDIEDIKVDKINAPEKAITSGKINLSEVKNINKIILSGMLILSLYNFPKHIVIILFTLLLFFIYNKPPFQLSRKPIASIVIMALVYSTLPLIYGYKLSSGVSNNKTFLVLVAFWFLVRFSVAMLKDFKDRKGDRLCNKKTFLLVYGKKFTVGLSIFLYIIGSIGIYLFNKNIFLLIFFARNLFLRFQLYKTDKIEKLKFTFHQLFFGQNQFDLVFLLCLIFGK